MPKIDSQACRSFDNAILRAETEIANAQKRLDDAKAAKEKGMLLWKRLEGLSEDELDILYKMLANHLGYDP